MNILQANIMQVRDIMLIVNQAKEYLKKQNIDQWQNGYPNEEVILEDIRLNRAYVVMIDDEVVGYFVNSYNDEVVYEHIYDGKWSRNDEYALIHRFCIKNEYKGQGIGSIVIKYVKNEALKKGIKQIRIDTHKLNNSMLRLFDKNGFTYVGKVCFEDNQERVAFELLF